MGPIEILFLSITLMFGAIGIVRGYPRELGVTTFLLIALFVVTFMNDRLGSQVDSLLAQAGVAESQVAALRALLYSVFLTIVVFVTYQGLGLIYPGSGKNWFVSMIVGLINGYLYAGSVWFFLDAADWPLGEVHAPFTPFYEFAVQILPPAIFGWQYFILVAVAMLLIRVLR